jgi:hypothetical protein
MVTHELGGIWGYYVGARAEVYDLGKPALATQTSSGVVTRVHVEEGAIVIAEFNSSYKTITKIRTDGTNSCTATIEYVLNSGSTGFVTHRIRDGVEVTDSIIRADYIRCNISDQPPGE